MSNYDTWKLRSDRDEYPAYEPNPEPDEAGDAEDERQQILNELGNHISPQQKLNSIKSWLQEEIIQRTSFGNHFEQGCSLNAIVPEPWCWIALSPIVVILSVILWRTN